MEGSADGGAGGGEGSRHDRLAAPEAMAVMQQMSYAPGVGPTVAAVEAASGPKKRGVFTTDSLLSMGEEGRGSGGRSGGGPGGDSGEEESGEEEERGRNNLLETQLIPLQPQPPIATFIYDWVLHRMAGWFFKKAAMVEEAQKKRRRDYGIDYDDEEEDMGHNPVIPPPQFAFLLPNARQRAQLKALARQNKGPMVMVRTPAARRKRWLQCGRGEMLGECCVVWRGRGLTKEGGESERERERVMAKTSNGNTSSKR